MYHHVRGNLVTKEPGEAVVEAGGVGYLLRIPFSTFVALPAVGKPVKLLAHLHVTDDALTLFGFTTEDERRFFLQLIGHVKGVGPRLALAVLSGGRLDHIQQAIRLGDVKALKAIKGLGEATAKRIVLELGKILVKEATEAEAAPKPKAARRSNSGQASGKALSAHDELTDLAVKAVMQLNEVPRDVALTAVQRALDEIGPDVDAPPAVQDLVTKALSYAE